MVSNGTAKLSAIIKMLDHCCSGYKIVNNGDHLYKIEWNGKTFWRLPKGEHGKNDPEIQKGHIKKMVSNLNIAKDCAKEMLPLLR